jgi:hypothetical protein
LKFRNYPKAGFILMVMAFSAFLGIGLSACASNDDPIDRVNGIYDKVIQIFQNSSLDSKSLKENVEQYFKSKKDDLSISQQQIMNEMSKIDNKDSRLKFIVRFSSYFDRVRDLEALYRLSILN